MKPGRIKPVVWCVWLASVLTAVSLVKNPLYQTIIVGAAGLVYAAAPRRDEESGAWGAFLKLGLSFLLISLVYNIIISHHGETIIAVLPAWIPLIGGSLTAEAAVFGLVFGLTFFTGIVAFAAFNKRVGPMELVRLLPRRLQAAATVVSVTFNFIPATGDAAREIREAQLIRGFDYGRSVAGAVKQAGGTITPLIVTGLEKAITTAESMESRGYGSGAALPRPERGRWSAADVILLLAAFVPAVVLIAASFGGWGNLGYQPYPALSQPAFQPALGLVLCLYAAPVAWRQ